MRLLPSLLFRLRVQRKNGACRGRPACLHVTSARALRSESACVCLACYWFGRPISTCWFPPLTCFPPCAPGAPPGAFLSDDHIVDYGGRNAAIALAITRPQLAPLSSQGLSEPPLAAFERLGRWGFELPRHGVASTPDEVAALKAEFETCQNSEGAVVYEEYAEIYRGNAPGDADAAGGASSSSSAAPTTRVLAIYKHKNFVYIMRRMARELVKRKAGFGGWRRRWAECHVPVEGSEQLARERDMLLAFYCWLARTKQLSAKPSEICRRYAGAYKSGAAAASAAGAGQGAAAAAAVAVPLTSWEECVQRLFKAILKCAQPEGSPPSAAQRPRPRKHSRMSVARLVVMTEEPDHPSPATHTSLIIAQQSSSQGVPRGCARGAANRHRRGGARAPPA